MLMRCEVLLLYGLVMVTGTAGIVCGRVCVTARHCLSHYSAGAAGLLLWARTARQTTDIDRQRRPPGAAAARRSGCSAQ